MRRSATIALVLAMTAALLVPQAQAQAVHHHQKTQHEVTPEQRAHVKAINVKFKACHNKATAQNIPPDQRYTFMKTCLAGH